MTSTGSSQAADSAMHPNLTPAVFNVGHAMQQRHRNRVQRRWSQWVLSILLAFFLLMIVGMYIAARFDARQKAKANSAPGMHIGDDAPATRRA